MRSRIAVDTSVFGGCEDVEFFVEVLAAEDIRAGAVGKNERADALQRVIATAVEQMFRVRDQLNREIEATSGTDWLDRAHGHRYASQFLQRVASKAASKAEASGAVHGNR